MNTKKQTKEKKAKQILMENNWFREYYYIKKVIESCKNDETGLTSVRVFNGTSSIMKARKWGFNTLERKTESLCERYPKYSNEIMDIHWKYKDDLRNYFEEVWGYIVDKMVKIKKDETTE